MPRKAELPLGEGPGIAAVRIKAIDEAAEEYVKERDKRCRLTPREIAAKQKLMDAMRRHADKLGRDPEGVMRYQYDELTVELRPGKDVLRVKASNNGDEDED